MTNFSSSSLFLMIIHFLSWINSSLINILTVKKAWSESIWDFGRMKWLLISMESGQMNTRSITKLELLELSAYQIRTWLTEENSLRSKEFAAYIRVSL